MRNGMFIWDHRAPSLGFDQRPYILRQIGYMAVRDESMLYFCQSPAGSCNCGLWTVAMSWSRRSFGRHPTALF